MPTAQGTRYFVQRAERLCCRPQESTRGHAGAPFEKAWCRSFSIDIRFIHRKSAHGDEQTFGVAWVCTKDSTGISGRILLAVCPDRTNTEPERGQRLNIWIL